MSESTKAFIRSSSTSSSDVSRQQKEKKWVCPDVTRTASVFVILKEHRLLMIPMTKSTMRTQARPIFPLSPFPVSSCTYSKSENSPLIFLSFRSDRRRLPFSFQSNLRHISRPFPGHTGRSYECRDSTDDVRLVLQWWSMPSSIRSSVVHCWFICITERVCSLHIFVRRSSAMMDWLNILERTSLSGRGMSLQRRTQTGRWESTERVMLCFYLSDWRNDVVSSFLTCSFQVIAMNVVRCCWRSFSVLLEKRMAFFWSTISLTSYNAATSWPRPTRGQLLRQCSNHYVPSNKTLYLIRSSWSRSMLLNQLYCVRMFWLKSPNISRWATPFMLSHWVFFHCFVKHMSRFIWTIRPNGLLRWFPNISIRDKSYRSISVTIPSNLAVIFQLLTSSSDWSVWLVAVYKNSACSSTPYIVCARSAVSLCGSTINLITVLFTILQICPIIKSLIFIFIARASFSILTGPKITLTYYWRITESPLSYSTWTTVRCVRPHTLVT